MKGRAVRAWLRERWMLLVAMAAAAASMFAVPPDEAYLGYFDGATLGCLFCVLAVAAAFRLMGAFDRLARAIIARASGPRVVSLALVLTTGALSALVTNDIALIVMLPLAAATLVGAGWVRLVPLVFSLQALAANLCGMITPFGNPQNLYLYTCYSLGLGEFLQAMALPFAVSLAGVAVVTAVLAAPRRSDGMRAEAPRCSNGARAETALRPAAAPQPVAGPPPAAPPHGGSRSAVDRPPVVMPLSRRRLGAYGALLAVTLLAVFRLIPVGVAVALVAGGLAIADRRALAAVDYPLLLTFACFFVFAGNMARVPILVETLSALMEQGGLLVAVGTSQIISNVPAAVLLSHFTGAWQPLLVGVNIGGAGTFVGSLASLIAIQHFVSARKIYPALRTEGAPTTAAFLGQFAALNFAFLAVLLLVCSA